MDQKSNIDLDKADEEILTSAVPDDALESAAGAPMGANSHWVFSTTICC